MSPILNKPMIALVMDSLVESGIKDFVIVHSPDANEIIDYFKHSYDKRDNLKIAFVEQKQPLGMANAIECTRDFIKEDVIISAGDSLVSSKVVKKLISSFYDGNKNVALTLLEVPYEKIAKMGIVTLDEKNRVVSIIEKPKPEEAPSNIGSIPLYAFSQRIYDYLPKVQVSPRGEYELQPAIQMMINDFGYANSCMADVRLDLTNLNDFYDINMLYLSKLQNSVIRSDLSQSVNIINKVFIGQNVQVSENCIIGPNVFIESDVVINEGCRLKDCIVLRNSKVDKGSSISKQIIIEDYVFCKE
jgi:dTDP-glucose pyrophosphorylase